MAFSVRIDGFGRNGKELLSMEPHWWDIAKLGERVNFNWITSNDTGSYRDEDADISIDEAHILHDQFKPELLRLIADARKSVEWYKNSADGKASTALKEYSDYLEKLQSSLNTLDNAVGEGAGDFSHFHVCVFEWESGF
jgi:hypothetical protein